MLLSLCVFSSSPEDFHFLSCCCNFSCCHFPTCILTRMSRSCLPCIYFFLSPTVIHSFANNVKDDLSFFKVHMNSLQTMHLNSCNNIISRGSWGRSLFLWPIVVLLILDLWFQMGRREGASIDHFTWKLVMHFHTNVVIKTLIKCCKRCWRLFV